MSFFGEGRTVDARLQVEEEEEEDDDGTHSETVPRLCAVSGKDVPLNPRFAANRLWKTQLEWPGNGGRVERGI